MTSLKRGFTLIELLVVCAITAVLTALVLPSISSAQDTARQNACKNNLKQFGLAMHNYHDAHKVLPPAWVSKLSDANEGPFIGWQVFLLPFQDQAPLYNQMNFSEIDKNSKELTQTVLPIMRCPSDPMVDLNPIRGKMGTSSYSGNAGDTRTPGTVDPLETTTGIMWRNSNCGFRDIKDGTSNTLMVGERCLDSGSGIWFGVTKNRNENDTMTDCHHENQLNAGVGSFTSRHPDGAMFLMCDGAVRFVSNNIESKPELGTYQKLANRNDGETIGDF